MITPEERYRRIQQLRRRAQPAGYVAVSWVIAATAFVLLVAGPDVSYALLLWFVVLVVGAATAGKAVVAGNARAAAYALVQCVAAPAVIAGLFTLRLHTMVWPGVIAFAACYLAVATPWALRIWRRRVTSFRAWECQSCGYPLVGLDGRLCPECGAPYDAVKVRAAAPPELREPWSSR